MRLLSRGQEAGFRLGTRAREVLCVAHEQDLGSTLSPPPSLCNPGKVPELRRAEPGKSLSMSATRVYVYLAKGSRVNEIKGLMRAGSPLISFAIAISLLSKVR